MKMASIDISSDAFVNDAQKKSSKFSGGIVLLDRDLDKKTGVDKKEPPVGAHLEISDSPIKHINFINLFGSDNRIRYKKKENSDERTYFDWRERFPDFEVGPEERNFITNLVCNYGLEESGWHIKMISESLDKSAAFSCLHFISFAMHRKGIAADRTVYNTLSSGGFFREYKMNAPRFCVSKYAQDYFYSYIKESSSFVEAIKRVECVVDEYCIINPLIFYALSFSVWDDLDVLSLLEKYSDKISMNNRLLSEEFFYNIESRISKISTIYKLYQLHSKPIISDKILMNLARFDKYSREYGVIVEFMSKRRLSICKKDLAAWVLESSSFSESLRRVRLAFHNNPTGYHCYASSLGDWIATRDDFAILKKFDEELRA